jgi:lipopolysaccharide transport system ATP-binding protein
MYVRLAFAVAAHLEPEILVVDEVLAVGDYAFQQKCLSKMQDVSTHGRTVLFVSHNMGAISRLCQSCVLLDQGRIVERGPTADVVQTYMTSGLLESPEYRQPADSTKEINLTRAAVLGSDNSVRADIGYHEGFTVLLEFEVNKPLTGTSVGIAIFLIDGTCAFATADFDSHPELLQLREPGRYSSVVRIPGQWLNVGRYSASVYLANSSSGIIYDSVDSIIFDIVDTGTPGSRNGVQRRGILQPILEWTVSTAQ